MYNATTNSTATNTSPAVVIENYKSGNSWYRIWSDGWIEQGGHVSVAANTLATVSLLIEMSDTYYAAKFSCTSWFNNDKYAIDQCIQRTSTTQIKLGNAWDSAVNFSWEVKGY